MSSIVQMAFFVHRSHIVDINLHEIVDGKKIFQGSSKKIRKYEKNFKIVKLKWKILLSKNI